MTKKKVSILGDSISTFEGYTVHQGLFYDRFIQNYSGVKSVEDTWWMQVIRELDAELGVNDSFSGSTVYGSVSTSGTSLKRLTALGAQGKPDMILVYMGTNDWGSYIMPTDFRDAYENMLTSIKILYPDAEIYCATLLRGEDPEDMSDLFINVEGCLSPKIYSQIIRESATKIGAKLADLEKYHMNYHTMDGVHPNAEGMREIAQLWLSEIK